MGVRDRFRKKLKAALNRTIEPDTPEANEAAKYDVMREEQPPDSQSEQETSNTPPIPPSTPPVKKTSKTPTPTLEAPSGNQADAPKRNAHLRPSFNTSTDSYTVSIVNEDNDIEETFPCEPDEFVLEAAERAGVELPYSCRSGGCLSCTGKLIEGDSEMGEQFVLEENHIAEGFRLLCCTTIQTNATFLAHQEEEVD